MPRFFEDLITGFAQGAGQAYKEKRESELSSDKIRQEAVARVAVERELIKAKEEAAVREQKRILEQNRQLAGFGANEETAAIFTTTPRTGPAVNISEQLPMTLADDSELDLPNIELNPMSNVTTAPGEAPLVASPQEYTVPQPRTMTVQQAMQKLPPEKQSVAMGMINSVEADGFTKAQKYIADELEKLDEPRRAGEKKAAELKAEQEAQVISPEELELRRKEAGLPAMRQARNTDKVSESRLIDYDKGTFSGSKEGEGQDKIATNDRILRIAKSFTQLNKTNTTGGIAAIIPFIPEIRSAFNAEFAAMDKDEKTLVMNAIKALGSGTAISDSDRVYASKASLSTLSPETANEYQAAVLMGLAQVDNEYREFAASARQNTNAEPSDITKMWKEYSNENPLFDHRTTVGNVMANSQRLTWQEYFNAKETGTLEQAKAAKQQNFQMNGLPGKPSAMPGRPNGDGSMPSKPTVTEDKKGKKIYDFSAY